jgi:hypothetical protein
MSSWLSFLPAGWGQLMFHAAFHPVGRSSGTTSRLPVWLGLRNGLNSRAILTSSSSGSSRIGTAEGLPRNNEAVVQLSSSRADCSSVSFAGSFLRDQNAFVRENQSSVIECDRPAMHLRPVSADSVRIQDQLCIVLDHSTCTPDIPSVTRISNRDLYPRTDLGYIPLISSLVGHRSILSDFAPTSSKHQLTVRSVGLSRR